MRSKAKIIALIITFILTAVSVQADVISVNFRREGKDAVTGEFGVVPSTNWVNVVIDTVNGTSVANVLGTGLNVTETSTTPGVVAVGDEAAWVGWANRAGVGRNGAALVSFELTNIPYDNYYVIVYFSGWNAGVGAVDDGTTTYYYKFDGLAKPSLVQATSTDSASPSVASYAVFGSAANPLTADSMTLTLTRIASMSGIGGFQIVQVPESKTIGLFLITSAGSLIFRKLKSI
ncbi:MAG: hypothetical protein WC959_02810 [Kiritimatiellales bacterium]